MFMLLRNRHRPWPARSDKVTLVFAPHQDDEALGCGGLISHRIALGEAVHIVYITDGAGSHPAHPEYTPPMISGLRADEARVAAGILGVPGSNLVFLKAPDGQLPHLDPNVRADLVTRIAACVERIAPSQVFVTSRLDGSSEHTAASALVSDALAVIRIARPRQLEYVVWSLWSPRLLRPALRIAKLVHRHTLSTEEYRLKQNAIRAYRSQIEPLAPWHYSTLPANFTRMFQDSEEFFFEF